MSQNRSNRAKGNGSKAGRSSNNKHSTVSVATSRKGTIGSPKISSSGNKGETIIKHKEFIQDVFGTDPAAFLTEDYSLNPGMNATFPWLATIASNFEKYRFKRLAFSYETACASITEGTNLMAIDRDALDQAPISKEDMMSYAGATRNALWQNQKLEMSSKELAGDRFVRSGQLPANADLKTYDVGTFFLSLYNSPSGQYLADLYVEYEVVLMTPQKNSRAAAFNSSVEVSGGGFPPTTTSNLFGSNPTSQGGLPMVVTSGGTLQFLQTGDFELSLVVGVATGSQTSNDIVVNTNTSVFYQVVDFITTLPQKLIRIVFAVTEIGQILDLDIGSPQSVVSSLLLLSDFFVDSGFTPLLLSRSVDCDKDLSIRPSILTRLPSGESAIANAQESIRMLSGVPPTTGGDTGREVLVRNRRKRAF